MRSVSCSGTDSAKRHRLLSASLPLRRVKCDFVQHRAIPKLDSKQETKTLAWEFSQLSFRWTSEAKRRAKNALSWQTPSSKTFFSEEVLQWNNKSHRGSNNYFPSFWRKDFKMLWAQSARKQRTLNSDVNFVCLVEGNCLRIAIVGLK